MELRHLRYFVAVAEELHFGRAAARLGIAQPPLSHQIQQLEQEVGVRLLQRTKRRVSLTEPGRAFLDQARVALAHADRAMGHARMAAQGQFGQVTVAFSDTTMLVGFIPAAVREYRTRYPGVKLALLQMLSADQISALKAGRVDVGVIIRGPACDETVNLTPLFHEPWVVAMPADHALAAQPALCLGALANEPFIFFSHQRSYGAFDEFARLCRAAGFAPQLAEEASGTLVALGLVASGLGLAMVSASTASIQFPGVVFRPLTDPTPGLEVAAIRRRSEASPAALAFWEVLAGCAAEHEARREMSPAARFVTAG